MHNCTAQWTGVDWEDFCVIVRDTSCSFAAYNKCSYGLIERAGTNNVYVEVGGPHSENPLKIPKSNSRDLP